MAYIVNGDLARKNAEDPAAYAEQHGGAEATFLGPGGLAWQPTTVGTGWKLTHSAKYLVVRSAHERPWELLRDTSGEEDYQYINRFDTAWDAMTAAANLAKAEAKVEAGEPERRPRAVRLFEAVEEETRPTTASTLWMLTEANRERLHWLAEEYGISLHSALNVAVSNEFRNVGGEAREALGD